MKNKREFENQVKLFDDVTFAMYQSHCISAEEFDEIRQSPLTPSLVFTVGMLCEFILELLKDER